jgi:ATP-binding cassette, subfamily B, bacterial MsbA
MDKFKQIFSLAKNYKRNLVASLIFNIFNAILSLFTFAAMVPLLRIIFRMGEQQPKMPEVTDHYSGEYWYDLACYKLDHFVNASPEGPLTALAAVCLAIAALALLKNVVYYIGLRNIAHIRTGVSRDLRRQLYFHLIQLSIGFFSNERKGDIMSRLTNDLFEVEFSVIGVVEAIFKSPTLIVSYLVVLFAIDWRLTLFALIFLPVSGFLISRVAKSLKNAARRGKDRLGSLMSLIEETLSGLRIIKAFNAEPRMRDRFDEENQSYFNLMIKMYRREYLASPMSEFISITVICLLLYLGGRIILGGSTWMDGSVFLLYLVIFSQIIPPARALSDAVFKINKGAASLERINEILYANIDVKDKEGATDLPSFEKSLEFKNVSFAYGEEVVLSEVSIEIRKGETIALVGPSGGGKSTLANLAARFYDVDRGTICIDGEPVTSYTVKSIRALMGIVSQESILFNDSVANNIALGFEKYDLEDVRKAAEIANATEFIDQLEGGLQCTIGDGGNKLSGGQKQRLSIARAVFANPPILILDEATSALDTHSEKLVQGAINNLMKNRTSLVIAHRLSTIQNADRIYVVEKGKIAEQGTHQQLIEQDGLYKRLVEMQEFD